MPGPHAYLCVARDPPLGQVEHPDLTRAGQGDEDTPAAWNVDQVARCLTHLHSFNDRVVFRVDERDVTGQRVQDQDLSVLHNAIPPQDDYGYPPAARPVVASD